MYNALAEKFPIFADEAVARRQRRWWIVNVLLPEKDEDGRILGLPEKKAKERKDEKDFYVEAWIKKGFPIERIDEKWEEIQEKIRKGKEEMDKLRRAQEEANKSSCAVPVGVDMSQVSGMRGEEDKPTRPKRAKDSRG